MKGKKGCASGGAVPMKVAGNPKVFEEAERKKGGRVKKDGKKVGAPEGEKAKHRRDRPHRKQGGRVGANAAPLSTAHNTTSAHKTGGRPD